MYDSSGSMYNCEPEDAPVARKSLLSFVNLGTQLQYSLLEDLLPEA